jgi:Uma2 family endonuclease
LYCIRNGCQLGWLIDPSERSVLVYQPNTLPDLLSGTDILPVLKDINLILRADDIFAWLKQRP